MASKECAFTCTPAAMCYTEKAPNAWQRRGTQKTRNTYNQPNRPQPTNLTDQAPSTTEGQPGRRITPINTAAMHASAQQQPTISTCGYVDAHACSIAAHSLTTYMGCLLYVQVSWRQVWGAFQVFSYISVHLRQAVARAGAPCSLPPLHVVHQPHRIEFPAMSVTGLPKQLVVAHAFHEA